MMSKSLQLIWLVKLRELASLRDDGIITDEEFQKMKEGILFKK